MQIKEQIHVAVNQMNMSELTLLYEYVRLLQEMKQMLGNTVTDISIEKILEMTASSTSCWSDAITQERENQT